MIEKPEAKVIPKDYDLEEALENFESAFTDHLDSAISSFLEDWTDEQMEHLDDSEDRDLTDRLSPVEDVLSHLKHDPWFEARQEMDSKLSGAINTAIIEFKDELKALIKQYYKPAGK